MDKPQKLSETLKGYMKEDRHKDHILYDSSDIWRCPERANL